MRLWGAEAPKRGRRLVERRGRDTKMLVKWLGCPDAGGAPKCWRCGWAGLTSSTHSPRAAAGNRRDGELVRELGKGVRDQLATAARHGAHAEDRQQPIDITGAGNIIMLVWRGWRCLLRRCS